MTITVDVAEDGVVRVRTADIGTFVQHFGSRISGRGVLLETQESLPRGRELELRMGLEEGLDLIEAVAMVAWKRRRAGDQSAAVGLHLLAVTSGSEFIQRLVQERTEAGRPVFDLDVAAPVSEDGTPIEADQIDRMIADRGERSAAADLTVEEEESSDAAESEEDSPDFAPGFGKSRTWNQQVQVGMPRSVSSLLGETEPSAAGRQAEADGIRGEGAKASEPSAPKHSERDEGKPPAPARASAPAVAEEKRASDATDRESWRSADPEVQPPESTSDDEPPAPGPLTASATSTTGSEPPKARKPGPIKMKLAADRQPSSSSASESLSGALESSFVEASRRAENLLREPSARPSEKTPAEALSTVVVKADEMKRMVERARVRAEEAERGTPEAGSGGTRIDESESERSSAEDETPPDPEPSLLNLDRAVLQSTTEDEFGYPQEDRTPMIIVGGIVLLIAVGLVLWLVLG